jgi:hypothetical protein
MTTFELHTTKLSDLLCVYGTFLLEPSCHSVLNVLLYPGFDDYTALKAGLKLAKKNCFSQ